MLQALSQQAQQAQMERWAEAPDEATVTERTREHWPAVGKHAVKLQSLQAMLAIQQVMPAHT